MFDRMIKNTAGPLLLQIDDFWGYIFACFGTTMTMVFFCWISRCFFFFLFWQFVFYFMHLGSESDWSVGSSTWVQEPWRRLAAAHQQVNWSVVSTDAVATSNAGRKRLHVALSFFRSSNGQHAKIRVYFVCFASQDSRFEKCRECIHALIKSRSLEWMLKICGCAWLFRILVAHRNGVHSRKQCGHSLGLQNRF